MEEDDRLMPVLNNINKQYMGREYTTSAIAGEIQAQDVDKVSQACSPPTLQDRLFFTETFNTHWTLILLRAKCTLYLQLKVHMPLCMEHLHNELRRDKHLKHYGRMQYGLFLKGIGLPLDQALIFWHMAFEKVTPDQFNKQYAYNLRHSYGVEGKRTDYTPYK